MRLLSIEIFWARNDVNRVFASEAKQSHEISRALTRENRRVNFLSQ
jgi:hypothetical protein